MTGAQTAFVVLGAATLAIGATTLLRPAFVRGLVGLKDNEAATYGLRIGGAMVAAFGLALVVLTLTVVTAR